jgi:protein Tex
MPLTCAWSASSRTRCWRSTAASRKRCCACVCTSKRRDWRGVIDEHFPEGIRSPFRAELQAAIEDAAGRLLLPAIERDVRRQLTETAESHAIQVFATNLRSLLSQPPLAGHTVLGIDPGFRTGCKVAVVDPTGKLLDSWHHLSA